MSSTMRRARLHLEGLEDRTAPAVFNVAPAAPDGAPGSLRAAINAADSNHDASNTIRLVAGTYKLSDSMQGNLLIQNTAQGVPGKTLTIVGQSEGQTIIAPASNTWSDRILQIVSTSNAVCNVKLQDLTITGGTAVNPGGSSSGAQPPVGSPGAGQNGGASGPTAHTTTALAAVVNGAGGGLLIEGAQVTLSNVAVLGNKAVGANLRGGAGYGGGICVNQGDLTLLDTTVANNQAVGGNGAGTGPLVYGGVSQGGNAYGGGIYFNGGRLTITASALLDNTAMGGAGGALLVGANSNTTVSSLSDSAQALASTPVSASLAASGPGGSACGGGVCIQTLSAFSLGGSLLIDNRAVGGNGGNGVSLDVALPLAVTPAGAGAQGSAGNPRAGNGGSGGSALGGGIAVSGAIAGKSILLENSTLIACTAVGGAGGAGGNGGTSGVGGNGGAGGAASGGSLAVQGVSAILVGGLMTRSSAVSGAGGTRGAGAAMGNDGPSPAATGSCIVSAGTVCITGTSLDGATQSGKAGRTWATGGGTVAGGVVVHGKLVVLMQPPHQVTAGSLFGLTVAVEDAFGNMIAGYDGPVTLSLASNPGNAGLKGNLTVTAKAGVATFLGLSLGKPAAGYFIQVNVGNASTTTSSLTVLAAAAKLAVTTSPPTTVAVGCPFGMTVKVEDGAGNVAVGFNGKVTVQLKNNPGAGSLGGVLQASAVNGVATFTGLTLNQPGKGYTLQVSTNALPPITTTAFTVLSDATTSLVGFASKMQVKRSSS